MTPSRQTMPLDGMRRRAWIATMDFPARSTAAASCDESSASALLLAVDFDAGMTTRMLETRSVSLIGRQLTIGRMGDGGGIRAQGILPRRARRTRSTNPS